MDLRRYLALVLRQWRPILLIVLVALAVPLFLSIFSPTIYEARAILQLSEQSEPQYASPPAAIQVLSSRDFLAEVTGAAGGTERPADLRGAITASAIRDTQMVRIRVRHRDPARARDLAQAAANHFQRRAAARVTERERILREQFGDVEEQLRRVDRLLRLSQDTLSRLQRARPEARPDGGFVASFALDAASVSQDLRERLQRSRNDLRREIVDLQFPMIIESSAGEPRLVARRTAPAMVFAGLLGLIIGGTVALLVEFLSQRTRPAGVAASALPSGRPRVSSDPRGDRP